MGIIILSADGGTATTPTWGSITGTLSNQTDLQAALDGKLDETFRYYNNLSSASIIYVKVAEFTTNSSFQKAVVKMDIGIAGNARDAGTLEIGIYGSSAYNTFLSPTHYSAYTIVGGEFASDAFYKVETDNTTNYVIEIWAKVDGFAGLFVNPYVTYVEGLTMNLLPPIPITSPTPPIGGTTIDVFRLNRKVNMLSSNFTEVTGGTGSFPVGVAYDTAKDTIHFYVNGEKMTNGAHYTATNTTITLIGFTLASGDQVLVEVLTNTL